MWLKAKNVCLFSYWLSYVVATTFCLFRHWLTVFCVYIQDTLLYFALLFFARLVLESRAPPLW